MEHWEKQWERDVPERRLHATLFTHRATGARVLSLTAPHDDNRAFTVAFRTPPTDDTGLAHIAEHSVLCGSKRYTTREPFVDLLKGSLQTFLNAFTYSDRTVYPVASRNPRDLHNLADVYLDACLAPRVAERRGVFMQEGWHYDIAGGAEGLAGAKMSGVVYSEMKGVYAQPDSVLDKRVREALFPGTCYRYDSGGVPEAIPTLTYEAFQAFHARCYHPSNSYAVLYGPDAASAEQTLALMHDLHYSRYARRDDLWQATAVPLQPPLAQRARVEAEYSIGADESGAEKTFVAMAWVLCCSDDAEAIMQAQGLAHLLFNKEGAPVREAVLKSHLAQDISAHVTHDLRQPFLTVVAKNASHENAQKIVEAVERCVRDAATGGFDREEVDGYLNRVEFGLREDDTSNAGVTRALEALRSWAHGGDPLAHLGWADNLERVRSGVRAGRYFEAAAERLLLKNNHAVVVVLRPSPGLSDRQTAEYEASVRRKLEALTPEGVAEVMAHAKEYAEWQAFENTPADFATVPKLSLSDVGRTADAFETRETTSPGGYRVRTYTAETNGVAYVRALFDASGVDPQEASLVTSLLQRLSTRSHTYAQMATRVDLHTGGTWESLDTWAQRYTPDFKACAQVVGKSLVRCVPELLDIMAEFTAETSFADHARLLALLREEKARLDDDLLSDSLHFASLRSRSRLSPSAAFNELTSGLSAYRLICSMLAGPFDGPGIQARLERCCATLFDRSRVWFFVCAEEHDIPGIVSQLGPLYASRLPSSDAAAAVPARAAAIKAPVETDEALVLESNVNFISTAWRVPEGAYTGATDVLLKIVELEYLWPALRVKGGAYGSWSNLYREGVATLSTYRDPRLRDSVREIAPATIAALFESGQLAMDPQDLEKFIISSVGERNPPLTASRRGDRALRRYLWGLTTADMQRELDELFGTTPEVLLQAARNVFGKPASSVCVCAATGEAALASAKDLFPTVTKAMP
eukprot:m51a1_g12390 putative M16 family metallopeptidase (981) ;mRNA; f:657347-660585